MDDELNSNNIGFQLLAKFGWKQGKGLGKSEQGIEEPISVKAAESNCGIGKQLEFDKVSCDATKDRKKMDVELEQTEEFIQRKTENAIRLDKIDVDIKNMNKVFYCSDCEKQYKNISEMTIHLSSYDHHHKKRFKDMKKDSKKWMSVSTDDATSSKKLKPYAGNGCCILDISNQEKQVTVTQSSDDADQPLAIITATITTTTAARSSRSAPVTSAFEIVEDSHQRSDPSDSSSGAGGGSSHTAAAEDPTVPVVLGLVGLSAPAKPFSMSLSSQKKRKF